MRQSAAYSNSRFVAALSKARIYWVGCTSSITDLYKDMVKKQCADDTKELSFKFQNSPEIDYLWAGVSQSLIIMIGS